jgi:hypothetical protein
MKVKEICVHKEEIDIKYEDGTSKIIVSDNIFFCNGGSNVPLSLFDYIERIEKENNIFLKRLEKINKIHKEVCDININLTLQIDRFNEHATKEAKNIYDLTEKNLHLSRLTLNIHKEKDKLERDMKFLTNKSNERFVDDALTIKHQKNKIEELDVISEIQYSKLEILDAWCLEQDNSVSKILSEMINRDYTKTG